MASYEPLHDSDDWQELSMAGRVGRIALCYSAWLAFVAWGCLTAILIRQTYLSFLPIWGPFVMTGVDRFSVLMIVIGLLVYVLFIEHYFRRGVVTGKLARRIWRVALWHLPVTALLFLATLIIPRMI